MNAWVDWSEREAHMFSKHGVTTSQADEALEDPERVSIEPDYASISGQGIRVIGYCPSRNELLSILIVVDDITGTLYGASGWVSNEKDQTIYYRKGEDNEQDF